MTIRVHQLAKELKISTAALKKHLADMGIHVKSHMSPLNDEIVEKIRSMFQQQTASIKQRQHDSAAYYKKITLRKTKQEKTTKKDSQKDKKEIPKEAVKNKEKKQKPKIEKKKQEQKPEEKKIPPKRSKDIPTYIKKDIKKKKKRKTKVEKKSTEKKAPPKQPEIIPENISKRERKRREKEQKEQEEKKFGFAKKHFTKSMKKKTSEQEEAEITKNIKKTLKATAKRKKKYKKDKTDRKEDAKIVVNEFTSVSELAKLMNIAPTEIIAKFFNLGQMVTINQRLDKDSLEMICDEFDFDVEFRDEYGTDIIKEEKAEIMEEANKELRPPIVTVMGHVDHGKTAILDRIRETNIVAGEAGGITQHIGAYQVSFDDRKITFLDTPGHEAFAAMRARGANITDIAVIVVAANESVKQQTIEAIDHARAAGVSIIVAINKIDLKDANIDRTISDLMRQNVMLEDYGGDILWVKCSAKTGEGINELLETILLSAEMAELQAAYDVPGKGIVIEAKKDDRMGTIATILLQEGILEKSDNIVCGATYGRIRKMENERGKELDKILPSDVAVIFGLNNVPKAGDIINKVEDEKTARQIGMERMHVRKERERYQSKTNLDNLYQKIKEEKMSELKLVIKGDTDGSVEALCDSFQKLSTEEVAVNIIHKAVGGIKEADVNLAAASNAVIIGFHVRTQSSARHLAEEENIDIKNYKIIYEAIEDIKNAMQGMLRPKFVEKSLGSAVVKQIFRISGVGTIAGCAVEKGKITNSGKVRLYRNDIQIHEGDLASLKHYQDEVKEVKAGSECGIGIKDYNDLKTGDLIENFIMEKVERKL